MKKCKNKRPFHIRVDIAESERTGEVVKYKVPILENYYNKLVWLRPDRFKKCKILCGGGEIRTPVRDRF